MKKLLLLVLFLLPATVLAANVSASSAMEDAGWRQLSPSQRAEIMKQVADTAAQNSPSLENIPAAQRIDEWVTVGAHIGQVLNGAAKEVGMALNDFMATPAGKVALVLIVWKIAGGAMLHFVGGVLVWVIGAIVMYALYRRYATTEISYDPEKFNIFGFHPKLSEHRSELSEGACWGLFLGSASFVFGGLIVMFTGG
ncbi:poly(A) polymerase I [Novimethylophilus kurashikiensis]|uniref:Poly(A) polymerase I n=1 Tax=Novimethylophilus kurashikiensis TaxID=1825523 RepID=A0A2R5F9N6_9PROT|nr:hypothetical protein [Novimethylophilus kurashikiensis]GBG14529.1 poly(A) polymerase I [Novimethylophilus kurashikiensis]